MTEKRKLKRTLTIQRKETKDDEEEGTEREDEGKEVAVRTAQTICQSECSAMALSMCCKYVTDYT